MSVVRSRAAQNRAELRLSRLPCCLVYFGGGFYGRRVDVPTGLILETGDRSCMFLGFARYYEDQSARGGGFHRCEVDSWNDYARPILGEGEPSDVDR